MFPYTGNDKLSNAKEAGKKPKREEALPAEERSQRLFNLIKEDFGYSDEEYTTFRRALDDPNRRKKLFDLIGEDFGYGDEEYEVFERFLGYTPSYVTNASPEAVSVLETQVVAKGLDPEQRSAVEAKMRGETADALKQSLAAKRAAEKSDEIRVSSAPNDVEQFIRERGGQDAEPESGTLPKATDPLRGGYVAPQTAEAMQRQEVPSPSKPSRPKVQYGTPEYFDLVDRWRKAVDEEDSLRESIGGFGDTEGLAKLRQAKANSTLLLEQIRRAEDARRVRDVSDEDLAIGSRVSAQPNKDVVDSFTEAIERLPSEVESGFGVAMQSLGALTPEESAALQLEASRDLEDISAKYVGKNLSLEDVENPSDLFVFIGQGLAGSLPGSGAAIFTAGANYASNIYLDMARMRSESTGKPLEDVIKDGDIDPNVAIATAGLSAATDVLGARVFASTLKTMKREALQRLVPKITRSLGEGFATEASQSVIEQGGTSYGATGDIKIDPVQVVGEGIVGMAFQGSSVPPGLAKRGISAVKSYLRQVANEVPGDITPAPTPTDSPVTTAEPSPSSAETATLKNEAAYRREVAVDDRAVEKYGQEPSTRASEIAAEIQDLSPSYKITESDLRNLSKGEDVFRERLSRNRMEVFSESNLESALAEEKPFSRDKALNQPIYSRPEDIPSLAEMSYEQAMNEVPETRGKAVPNPTPEQVYTAKMRAIFKRAENGYYDSPQEIREAYQQLKSQTPNTTINEQPQEVREQAQSNETQSNVDEGQVDGQNLPRTEEVSTRGQDEGLLTEPAPPAVVSEDQDIDLTDPAARQYFESMAAEVRKLIQGDRKNLPKARDLFRAYIKPILRDKEVRGGKVTVNQLLRLADRVARVRTNDGLASILDDLEKFISNTDFFNKVEQAKKLQRKVKRSALKDFTSRKDYKRIKALANVNPKKAINLDGLISALSDALPSRLGESRRLISGLELDSYINAEIENSSRLKEEREQRRRQRDAERINEAVLASTGNAEIAERAASEDYDEDVPTPEGASAMSSQVISDVVDAGRRSTGLKSDVRTAMEAILKEAQEDLAAYDQEGLSPKEVEVVNALLEFSPDMSNIKDIRRIINSIENILVDDDFSGYANFAVAQKAAKDTKRKLIEFLDGKTLRSIFGEDGTIYRKINKSRSLRGYLLGTQTVQNILNNIAIDHKTMVKLRSLLYQPWTSAAAKFEKSFEAGTAKIDKIFAQHVRGFDEAVHLDMVNNIVQYDIDEDPNVAFARRKQNVLDSINRAVQSQNLAGELFGMNPTRDQELAKRELEIFNSKIKDAETREQLLETLSPGQRIARQAIIDIFAEIRDRFYEQSSLFDGYRPSQAVDYVPTRVIKITNNPLEILKLDDLSSITDATFNQGTVDSDGATTAISRVRGRLSPNRRYAFDPLVNFRVAYRETMFALETREARATLQKIFQDPDIAKALGQENAQALFGALVNEVVQQGRVGVPGGPIARLLNRHLSTIVKLILGSVRQYPMQYLSSLGQAMSMGKSGGALTGYMALQRFQSAYVGDNSFSRAVSEAFTKYGVSVGLRDSFNNENFMMDQMKNEIAVLAYGANRVTAKWMGSAYSRLQEAQRTFGHTIGQILSRPDKAISVDIFLSSYATWLHKAGYLDDISDFDPNQHFLNADINGIPENVVLEAIASGEALVETVNNKSRASQAPKILDSNSQEQRLLKNMFFGLKSFAINQSQTLVAAIRNISEGTQYARSIGYQALFGIALNSIIANTIRVLFENTSNSVVNTVGGYLYGVEEPEDELSDDRDAVKLKQSILKWGSQSFADIAFGAAPGGVEDALRMSLNGLIKASMGQDRLGEPELKVGPLYVDSDVLQVNFIGGLSQDIDLASKTIDYISNLDRTGQWEQLPTSTKMWLQANAYLRPMMTLTGFMPTDIDRIGKQTLRRVLNTKDLAAIQGDDNPLKQFILATQTFERDTELALRAIAQDYVDEMIESGKLKQGGDLRENARVLAEANRDLRFGGSSRAYREMTGEERKYATLIASEVLSYARKVGYLPSDSEETLLKSATSTEAKIYYLRVHFEKLGIVSDKTKQREEVRRLVKENVISPSVYQNYVMTYGKNTGMAEESGEE